MRARWLHPSWQKRRLPWSWAKKSGHPGPSHRRIGWGPVSTSTHDVASRARTRPDAAGAHVANASRRLTGVVDDHRDVRAGRRGVAVDDPHRRGLERPSLAPRGDEGAHRVAELTEEDHVVHAIAARDALTAAARSPGFREEVEHLGVRLVPGVREADGHGAADDGELVVHAVTITRSLFRHPPRRGLGPLRARVERCARAVRGTSPRVDQARAWSKTTKPAMPGVSSRPPRAPR